MRGCSQPRALLPVASAPFRPPIVLDGSIAPRFLLETKNNPSGQSPSEGGALTVRLRRLVVRGGATRRGCGYNAPARPNDQVLGATGVRSQSQHDRLTIA